MKELFEEATSRGTCGRSNEVEALDVLRSVRSVIHPPGGVLSNHNIWSPVVATNAVEARIFRLSVAA